MAGSIFRKVRGVLAKFWAYLQLLLNYKGVRVDINKTGGLFRKKDRPNRYPWILAVGSRSDGSDWIGPRSNRDRWARIGGPWEFGRVGRRRDVAGDSVHGGAWPEKG